LSGLPDGSGDSASRRRVSMPSIIRKIAAKTSPVHALLVAKRTDSGRIQRQ
jgi:hypothetical protein